MPRKPLTASNGPSGRPPPTQVRSQERYEAILLAAETEIGDVGFEELTITRIADRAGITSTSIYRYFESVEEILAVLTERNIEQLEREIQPLVSESVTTQALIEAFAAALRQSWAMYHSRPVAKGIWTATRFLRNLRELDDALNARSVELFVARGQLLQPNVDAGELRMVLTLFVGLATPMLDLAIHQPKRSQSRIVDEYIELAVARLGKVLGPI